MLKSNLLSRKKEMVKIGIIVATCSGKGGVGKSTFSISTAITLAKDNNKVLLIDMDAGMRCLDLLLGVSEKLVFDVSDAVEGKDLEDCIIQIPEQNDLYLLAAPSNNETVSEESFKIFIEKVSEDFDAVIIDFSAGNDVSLLSALPFDAQIVCVCNPDAVSIRDAYSINCLLAKKGKKARLVLNKYNYYFIKSRAFSTIDDIINETGMQLLGIVPFSEDFEYAFCTGDFALRGRGKKAFKRIAKRLQGKNEPLKKLKKI